VAGRFISPEERQRMLDDVLNAAGEPVPAAVARQPTCACHGGRPAAA
jgi:hypothetical protein